AASLASPPPIQPMAKQPKATARTMHPAPTCQSIVPPLIPMTRANRRKPPMRISDTRFEIVMVKRSLDAAKAIIAGKSTSPSAVATMVDISQHIDHRVDRDVDRMQRETNSDRGLLPFS